MKECKGMDKEKFLSLIDQCISGKVVLEQDIADVLSAYGDTYVQLEGAIGWNLRSEIVGKHISLRKALMYAKEGCFVTSSTFSSDQSLHYWNGKFYYEDGAVVTPEFLDNEDWATELPWNVVAFKDEVDTDMLNKMHTTSRGYMLDTGSYMDCIK